MEYWNKLPAQKKEWVKWIAVVLLVGILGLLGITQPTIPVPPTPAPAVGGEIGARAVARTGIICNGGETNCVDARSGKDIVTYADADAATRTWYVDGATGNQTSSGYYSGSNWAKVAAPTAIATATPAFVVNSAGVSNLFEAQKNATPVVQVSGAGNLVAVSADTGGGFGSTGCTVSSAGALSCDGATTLGSTLTVTGTSTLANVSSSATITATTLVMGSDSFTGAIKYGTESTYTSGAAITHGFTVTPTACLMFPSRDVTETVTLGATTFSSDRATQAVPVYWLCGK